MKDYENIDGLFREYLSLTNGGRHYEKLRWTKVEVDSAGTASYHIGSQPDKRMIATAFEHGIDISNLRARQFQA